MAQYAAEHAASSHWIITSTSTCAGVAITGHEPGAKWRYGTADESDAGHARKMVAAQTPAQRQT